MTYSVRYFARNGDEITMEQWSRLLGDTGYKIVKQERTDRGTLVSTVWLGLDHSFTFGDDPVPPLIFETMVFSKTEALKDEYMDRYTTEEQALEGHGRIANMVRELEGIEHGVTRQADRAPGITGSGSPQDEERNPDLRTTTDERDVHDPQHTIGSPESRE